jgi:ubiquinone/menaquinone biosynthesis C-methylase UbiE
VQAEEYSRMFELEDHYWWFVARRELALSLLKQYGLSHPTILDIGCGTGVVLSELEKLGTATGFDYSEHALDFCRKRGLKRLVQGDAHRLPFADATFDAVIGLDVFEHLERDEEAFRQVQRILKPGGILILSVPAFMSLWGPHDVALMHFRRYRKNEVARKLRAAGLRPIKLSYSVFLLFPLVAVIRFFERRRKGPAQANLPDIPSWMNRALIWLQRFEQTLTRFVNLPWGSSVICVAKRDV